jgi:hypothetical protein
MNGGDGWHAAASTEAGFGTTHSSFYVCAGLDYGGACSFVGLV